MGINLQKIRFELDAGDKISAAQFSFKCVTMFSSWAFSCCLEDTIFHRVQNLLALDLPIPIAVLIESIFKISTSV
jgi:hypothetical protein